MILKHGFFTAEIALKSDDNEMTFIFNKIV
jgi:hypothetical protein